MSIVRNNIVYNLIGQSILFALSLIAVKFIFSQLGGDILGVIYFTILMNRILCNLLSKGLCAPAVREVSTYFETEVGYVRDFIRTGSLICWAIFSLFSILVIFLAPVLVNNWITLKTLDYETATMVLRFLGVATLFAFPVSFYLSLIQGLQKMEINNSVDVISAIIEQVGIILILTVNDHVFYIILWIFCSRCLKVVAYLIVISRYFGIISLIPNYSKYVVQRNSKFALNMIYVSIFVFANKQADKVLTSKMLPISVFGYYGYVCELVSKVLSFTVAVAQAAYPSFCSLSQVGNKKTLVSQYVKLQDFVCFVMVPLFAAVSFMTLPVLSFVFNREIARMLLLPVTLLSIGAYMNGSLSLPHRILLAFGKPEIAARQYMYSFFIAVPIIGALTYIWGLPGAASSLILIYLVGYFYMIPKVFTQCLEMPAWYFFWRIIKIFLLTIVSYGSAFLFLTILDNFTLFSLILAYISASIIFLIIGYFIISNELRIIFSVQNLKNSVVGVFRFS